MYLALSMALPTIKPGALQSEPGKRELAMARDDSVRLIFEQQAFRAFLEYTRLTHSPHLKEFLENLEKSVLCRLLVRFNGNQRRTADYLGIKYTTFNGKVKKYGICFRKTPLRRSARPPIF
jgi:DNA-binding NtrC family response regulator